MVAADVALHVLSVLLPQLIQIAAGNLAFAVLQDGVDQRPVLDDQIRQQQIRRVSGSPAHVVDVPFGEVADILQADAFRGMVVGHGHPLKGGDGGRGEHLLRRPDHRNQGIPPRRGQPQLPGQVLLRARPGHRHVQAQQVAFRLPAGDVFRKAGSVILHASSFLPAVRAGR